MKLYNLYILPKYPDKKILSQIITNLKKIKSSDIYTSDIFLTNKEIANIDEYYDKVTIEDYPIQYIFGTEKFLDHEFVVDHNVLIPRAETEYMVKYALWQIWENAKKNIISDSLDKYNPVIYDVWTGSGAIWISMAIWLTEAVIDADIYMLDISDGALSIARRNIAKFSSQISPDLYISSGYSDLLSEVKFDDLWASDDIYILANLPYVDQSDYDANITQLRREPKIALVAEDKWLTLYYKLLDDIISRATLNHKNIYIYLEINDWQMDIIRDKYLDIFQIDYISAWHSHIYIMILQKFVYIKKQEPAV